MKFWVSAYNKKIYKINLSKNGKVQEIGMVNNSIINETAAIKVIDNIIF